MKAPTRKELEPEREALVACRERAYIALNRPLYEALTASIARLDALLSLSDEQCAHIIEVHDDHRDFALAHGYSDRAAAHRTVAEIVRRAT